MDTATPRIDPEEVLITKLVSYGMVQNADSGCDEGPTPFANARVGATCPNGIVVSHIDIEDQLPLKWLECASSHCFFVSRLRREYYEQIARCKSSNQRTRAEYTGPISNRVGFSWQTCFLRSSAVAKELYRRYTSPARVNAHSL